MSTSANAMNALHGMRTAEPMAAWPTQADLGGQTGHGAITPEPEERRAEELFHAPWEPRALALTLAMGATGCWNIDTSRAARETLDDYARSTYYQIWLAALQRLLQERGLVQADELAAGQALHPAQALPRVLHAADVPRVLAAGSPTSRSAASAPTPAPAFPAPPLLGPAAVSSSRNTSGSLSTGLSWIIRGGRVASSCGMGVIA